MPGGEHQESGASSGPEWPVWLAASRIPDGAEAVRSAKNWVVLTGVLAAVALFCAAVRFACLALAAGHHTVLSWLAWGHLPALAMVVIGIRFWRQHRRETPPPAPPSSQGRFGLYGVFTDTGVHHDGHLFVPWERCRGFAYLEPDGPAFVVRLWIDEVTTARPNRSGYALEMFAVFAPTLITVASALVGFARFGPREDVLAATCAALLHLLVVGPFVASVFEKPKRGGKPAAMLDLLFDSRQVTASEAMARIGRHVPPGAPPAED